MTDQTPRTEAGQALVAELMRLYPLVTRDSFLDTILAIEAQARAEGLDVEATPDTTALREAFMALDYRMVEWWHLNGESYSLVQVVNRLAVLRLIEAQARAEGLDVEVLKRAMSLHEDDQPAIYEPHGCDFGCATDIAQIYRAILAARRDEG